MAEKLTDDERAEAKNKLTGWTFESERDAISREYKFSDFRQAFAFMCHAALDAEKLDHHPEWSNVYNRVSVTLTTHDAEGLTKLDVSLAQKMDEAASKLGASSG